MSKDQKLFDLLIKFGFKKTEDDKKIVFKKDDEIFVYPPTKLQKRHYMATRKHLDMNNWIKESEFDLIFK